ncbi:PREDICTED: receptor-like protein kinase FERONIA [Ipomoea nil]|uniref:receptor-like protein kinase FERONIA n=1 Tax=Ipomoea nil TaxID=35883 RepID=UPI000900D005|nr:PREDICTED: receptor-like protein kinase FERONIA [Ipomoea nil]
MLAFALRLSFPIIIFHFLALRLADTTAAAAPLYKATEFFLLSCGAPSKSTSQDGRDWDTDNHYLQFMPTNTAELSSPAIAEQGPLASQVPFTTARVFTSELTYSFRVSPGQKFLRLYFYPANYSAAAGGGGRRFNKTDFFFTVTANNYTLLKNFSAFLTVSSPDPFVFSPDPFIKKEFIVNVDDKQQLNLTFSPSPYAFVNGIEIVSMPSDLYFRGDNNNYPIISAVHFDNSTTMETLYRLNVGSRHLGPKDDTGMFREWSVDDYYVVDLMYQTPFLPVPVYYTNQTPAYTAPDLVYTSARVMDKSNRNGLFWLFPVDAGFFYLFRFYFCEFEPEFTTVYQRVFSIEINKQMVEDDVDVIDQSGGREVPIMKDYVVFVPDPDRRRSKHNVSLVLRPNMKDKPVYFSAILNGLEIFKLNDSTGNLAVPNPPEIPAIQSGLMPEKKGRKGLVAIIGGLVGGVAALLLVIILIIFLIFRRRKRMPNLAPSVTKSSWVTMARDSITTQKTGGSDGSRLPLDLCRHFSLDELKRATGNFNDNFVIGRGGFGKVYLGYIDGADKTSVAIKRLSPESSQGFREFQTEIKMLSKLRHLHLVSLIGYCDTDREMILVYDYMAHGTLRDHLYKAAGKPPLPWKQRLKICIGAAKGLHYLHAGARHPIIHRDVKSTNILLDEKWVAKLSDFGLSKVGPLGEAVSHVSTAVKGSFGYVDPEYYRRRQVTEKSDVYSFGVVLFEVLCARAAVIPNLPRNKVSLAEWGRRSYETGDVSEIVDPNLKGQIASECLIQYVEIACNCLKDQGIDRPAMNDVVWGLEFALQLQDAADKRGGLSPPRTPERPGFPLLAKGGDGEAANKSDEDYGGAFTTSENAEKLFRTKSSATATSTSDDSLRGQSHTIFSELSNQLGR